MSSDALVQTWREFEDEQLGDGEGREAKRLKSRSEAPTSSSPSELLSKQWSIM